MRNKKKITLFLLVLITITLPLLLILAKQNQDNRSSAAAADKLEAEEGTLGGNAVSKQDSLTSGGSYIELGLNQNSQIAGIYGPGINIDSKNNNIIGGSNNAKLSHKFKASTTSNLNHIIWALRVNDSTSTGYSKGDNGSYKISIQSDDGTINHLPSGSKLAESSGAPGAGNFGGLNRKTVFSNPPLLQKGQIYHVVWENISADPINNYFSVNEIFTFDKLTPRQPILNDTDYACLYNIGSGWSVQVNNTADMDLGYTDGTHDGVAYLQAFYDSEGTNAQEIVSRISGSQMAREIFTVSGGDRTVSKAFVRIGREFGNSPLTVSLKTASGSVIESKTVLATNVALWSAYTVSQMTGTTNPTWVSVDFSTPRTLLNGQTYQLVLSSPSDSKYSMLPIRYVDFTPGFDTPSTAMQSYAFRDGKAQDTQNGGTTWEDVYSFQSWSNMQFYFTTTTPAQIPTPTISGSNITYTDYSVPTSIDKTGLTDVTTALNNWITSVPNGTDSLHHVRLVFPSGSTYMVSRGINIGNKSHMTFQGNGSIIKINPLATTPSQYTSAFNVGFSYGGSENSVPSQRPSADIRITGFSARGNNPNPGYWDTHNGQAWENQAFIMSNGTKGLEVDHNSNVTALGGDFVQTLGNETSNLHIHDNSQLDSGRQFVSITGSASNVIIENNNMGNVGYYFLDLEPTSSANYNISDVQFVNNTGKQWSKRSNQGGGFVAIGDGTNTTWTIQRVKVSGNTLTGTNLPSTEGSSLITFIGQNMGGATRMNNIEFSNNTGSMAPPSSSTANCTQNTLGQNGGLIQVKKVDGLIVTGNKNKGPIGPFLCTVDTINITQSNNISF